MADEKRAKYGDGSVRRRPDGRLEKRISLGTDPATGKHVRKSVYGKTLREVQRKAKTLELRWREGLLVSAKDRITLSQHFYKWIERRTVEIEGRTVHNYKRDFERYLEPQLGTVRLDPAVLTEDRVKTWHTALAMQHGAYIANRALALLALLLQDHKVMRRANPARLVPNAKHEKRPVEILTAEELGIFLPATKTTRIRHMVKLALATGLRHGEATALTWSDVNLYPRPAQNGDMGEIHVRRAVVLDSEGKRGIGRPKSKSAIRTIGLMPEAAEALKQQRLLLAAEGQGDSELVFPNQLGGLQDESNTHRSLWAVIDRCNPRLMQRVEEEAQLLHRSGVSLREARRRARKAVMSSPGLPSLLDVKYVSFHDLRHTFASMMIAAGMDAPRLSVLLGHSDAAFTMRTYVHFFEQQKRPGMPSIRQFVPSLEPVWGEQTETPEQTPN